MMASRSLITSVMVCAGMMYPAFFNVWGDHIPFYRTEFIRLRPTFLTFAPVPPSRGSGVHQLFVERFRFIFQRDALRVQDLLKTLVVAGGFAAAAQVSVNVHYLAMQILPTRVRIDRFQQQAQRLLWSPLVEAYFRHATECLKIAGLVFI